MTRKIAAVRALVKSSILGETRPSASMSFWTTASPLRPRRPLGLRRGKTKPSDMRDGDKKRYGGKGVLKAVANVNELIAPKLIGI